MYVPPVAEQFADVAADQARLTFVQSQLHAINVAIMQARQRGDAAGVAKLQTFYRAVLQEAATLLAKLRKQEMPSEVMQGVARLSDGIQQLTKSALGAAETGIKTLGGAVLWPLAIVAVVAGAVYLLPRRRQAAA